MDKLIKASLIASIVTIGGNSEEEDEEKDKNTDEASLLKTIVTCNNCFKGFDDKETPNK